jgi:hypothetical protein
MIAAASAAAPAAAGAAGVLVRLPGAERHLSPEEIGAAVDRPAGTYLLRAAGTTAEPVAHPPALSVRRLVAIAGGSPDALTFVTIERPNGSLALLGRGDLTDPAPFPDGPPIVWMDAGGARYLRPLRGPDDANGADNVDITAGELVVRVHQGPLLVVRATADRREVRAGTAVHFGVEIVSGAGQGLRYAWRFGDGAAASGPAVSHAFAAPGVYEAVVTVSGTDDAGGSSAPLRIRVGDPPNDDGGAGGGTGDRRRAPAQGPVEGDDDGGGGASSATPAPDAHAPTAPAATAPAPTAPAATAPAATAPAPGSPAPAAPAPVRPAPSPTASPRPAAPARRERRVPAPKRASAPPRRPVGSVVRGTLVAASLATPLPGGARPAAVRPAVARRGRDPVRRPLAPAVGVLAALALVGLGARRERRALRRYREVV